MGSTEAQIKASKKWLDAHGKERYDRVQVVFPKGLKVKVVKAAKRHGMSLSGYITKKVRESIQVVDTRHYCYAAGNDLRKGIIMKKIQFNCSWDLDECVMGLVPYQEKEIAEFEKQTGIKFPEDVSATLEVDENDADEDGCFSEEVSQKYFEILKEDVLRQMKELGVDAKYLDFTTDTDDEFDDEDDE